MVLHTSVSHEVLNCLGNCYMASPGKLELHLSITASPTAVTLFSFLPNGYCVYGSSSFEYAPSRLHVFVVCIGKMEEKASFILQQVAQYKTLDKVHRPEGMSIHPMLSMVEVATAAIPVFFSCVLFEKHYIG